MIKKWTNYFGISLAILSVVVFALLPEATMDLSNFATTGQKVDYTVTNDIAMLSVDKIHDSKTEKPFSPFLGKKYNGFKEALAFKESRGNYTAVNDFGYIGKYQFGVETLKLLGIFNPNDFLYNPELQEKAFFANAQRNKWILRKDILRFEGKIINGVTITESGILAAAHLAGAGSVKKFLRSYGNETFSDAFGTSIRSYMKKFSGYDTSSITPNRLAKVTL